MNTTTLIDKINTLGGYSSTDLRLYTSTKQRIVHYLFYSLMHKEQNLYLNNI